MSFFSSMLFQNSQKRLSDFLWFFTVGNDDILKAIDGAAFNLVLGDEGSEDPRELSQRFMYGNGANK